MHGLVPDVEKGAHYYKAVEGVAEETVELKGKTERGGTGAGEKLGKHIGDEENNSGGYCAGGKGVEMKLTLIETKSSTRETTNMMGGKGGDVCRVDEGWGDIVEHYDGAKD